MSDRCPICCSPYKCGCLDEPEPAEPTGPEQCPGLDGAIGCYQVEGHEGPCDAKSDPREVSPGDLRDLRERIERHRKNEPRKLNDGKVTVAWTAWHAAGEVIERIAALLAHIDAQTEQLRRAKAREEAYEAVLWMAERFAEGDRNDADTLAEWMQQVEANR